MHPFSDGIGSPVPPRIHTLKFKAGLGAETESLYLGTETGLLRVPTSRCVRFRRKNDCVSSGDPYCGWNTKTEKCTTAPNNNPATSYWKQSPSGFQCPDKSIEVRNNSVLSNSVLILTNFAQDVSIANKHISKYFHNR